MRTGRWARPVRRLRVAALLAPLAVLLTGCSTPNISFGFLRGVTKQAHEIRTLWTWSCITALTLGVIVWGLIFWCCIRYRKRNDDIPRQTKYNFWIEITCFAFPFFVITGLFIGTVNVEDDVNHLSANPDVSIQVDAFKWNWQFEYHGYRGMTGHESAKPTSLAYTNPATGKPLVDRLHNQPPLYLYTVGSQFEIPVLVVPVNQKVQVDEHSYDVIHSFWVPEFLFKRDVFPYGGNQTNINNNNSDARDNKFEFTATSTGSFVGRCAELCGIYHSQMNFEVRVVPQKTFVAYVDALKKIGPYDPARQAKALKMAMPNQSAYATTTFPIEPNRKSMAQSRKGELVK